MIYFPTLLFDNMHSFRIHWRIGGRIDIVAKNEGRTENTRRLAESAISDLASELVNESITRGNGYSFSADQDLPTLFGTKRLPLVSLDFSAVFTDMSDHGCRTPLL